MNRTNNAYGENADIQNFCSEAPRNDSNFVIDVVFPKKKLSARRYEHDLSGQLPKIRSDFRDDIKI